MAGCIEGAVGGGGWGQQWGGGNGGRGSLVGPLRPKQCAGVGIEGPDVGVNL